jgi:FMN reductase
MSLSVVGISGSVRRVSRTTGLVRAVLDAVDRRVDGRSRLIELVDAAPLLFSALTRAETRAEAEQIVRAVEQADILVVGTPVYRASYTGALKHLFDLVRHEALTGAKVVLVATGGTPLHGLMTEHQLRPLLSFFGAFTAPTAIYATESDFHDDVLTSRAVFERIDRAAGEIARLCDAGTCPSSRLVAAQA